jgi:protein-disulfide isomerase
MKRLKSVLDTSVTLLVVVAAGLVIWRHFVPWQPQPRPPVEDATGKVPADLATNVRGTGAVALVEFADFECPFCARHAREVDPAIRQAFVDSGVLRQVFVNYPLGNHSRAQPASEAAQCAGSQGKFWEMHDAIFRGQPPALGDGDFADRAREIELDLTTFSDCLTGGETRSVIERHKSLAADLGIRSTPAFFVGVVQADGSVDLKKRINGAVPFTEFRAAISEVMPPELRPQIREVALNPPHSGAGGLFGV